MGNFRMRWRSIAQVMLFSAAAFLVCGTELAQGTTPVNGFVIINPISVCSGGLCAPFGVSCTSASGTQVCTQSATPSAATVNTPIGFVDADKNVNLARAFWAQAGLDVAFFPVQSYNSPTNTIPSSWNNIKDAAPPGNTFTYSSTNYQTLHLVNVLCQDGFTALTSPDFQALTQHPLCTEHGGLAGTYSKLTNPPPAPSTAPPLAIKGCSLALPCDTNSNAIDVFFVNTYSGTGVSTPQYGFSWINGDGVSVGKLAFTQSRFDTLAHEIGHALALDHVTFGAATDPVNIPVGNMMLLGSTRATSSKSGCQTTTGTTSTPPPVYNGGALFDLDYITPSFNPCSGAGSMLADHLTTGPACPSPLSPATCNNQGGAAALSPFINKTLPNNANAGGGTPFLASTTTTSTTSPSGPGTPTPLSITITANGDPNDPDIPDLAANIIALPPSDPLSFSGNSPVTQTGGTGCQRDSNGNLINCAVFLTSVEKLGNNKGTGNFNCDKTIINGTPGSQCVKMTYSDGFGPGINVILAVSFNKDSGTIIAQNLLTGAQYTAIDNKGFATTSLFGPVRDINGNIVGFEANSQNPDLTTPNVLLDQSHFQNASAVKLGPILSKCTPPYTFVKAKGQLVPVCPDGNLPAGPD